jgi:3-methyladenine DNA glycosylase AlkD
LLRTVADRELAEQYARISSTKGTVLGITVPALRVMVKEFAAGARGLSVDQAVRMGDAAFASDCREEILFAVFLIARFKARLGPTHWAAINRWVERLDNWETCDQLAMGVAGEMIGRADAAQRAKYVKDLLKWTDAPNPWRRRFAVATTTVLNQKGRNDASVAVRVCERLITDDDRSVQMAVGWALREACKSDADAVFALLNNHKDRMPGRVLRMSAEKLPAARRATLGLK